MSLPLQDALRQGGAIWLNALRSRWAPRVSLRRHDAAFAADWSLLLE